MTRPSTTHTVLVVEDQPELREVLCHVLTDGPIEAIGVEDGQAAVEWLRARPTPGAIVLDLMLPRLDGCRVLDWLRTEPRLSGVPVVVISAAPRDTIAVALAHGPAQFLPKPLDAVRLVRAVRGVCGLDPDGDVRRVA